MSSLLPCPPPSAHRSKNLAGPIPIGSLGSVQWRTRHFVLVANGLPSHRCKGAGFANLHQYLAAELSMVVKPGRLGRGLESGGVMAGIGVEPRRPGEVHRAGLGVRGIEIQEVVLVSAGHG